MVGEKEQEIGEARYNSTREINAINKILEGKTRELEKATAATAESEKERQRLLEKVVL